MGAAISEIVLVNRKKRIATEQEVAVETNMGEKKKKRGEETKCAASGISAR